MALDRSQQVEVTGLRDVKKLLAAVDRDLTKGLKAINLEAARVVLEAALERVPVGDSSVDPHPGLLRRSLRASGTLNAGVVRAGGTKVPYAPPIHWGWDSRNIAPQPFVYDALDARRIEVLARYEAGVKRIVREAEARSVRQAFGGK